MAPLGDVLHRGIVTKPPGDHPLDEGMICVEFTPPVKTMRPYDLSPKFPPLREVESWVAVTPIVTRFLGSVERCFSVPAAAAASCGSC